MNNEQTSRRLERAAYGSKYMDPVTGKRFSGAKKRKMKREAAQMHKMTPYDRPDETPQSTSEDRQPMVPPEPTSVVPSSTPTTDIKMAIIDAEYPQKAISEEQAELIKAWLIQTIDEGDAKKGPHPQFLGCKLEGSVVLITCFDENTRTWLEDKMQNCKPWEGANLALLKAKNIPIEAKVFIPGAKEDPMKVITRIGLQNKVNTTEWRVINQEDVPEGQVLTVKIERTSWDRMGRLYEHRPFLNFGRVKFKTPEETGEIEDLQKPGSPQS